MNAPIVLQPISLPHPFGATYVLFDRIGVGGMAEIYLARGKTRVGATRLAVVKLVNPALAGDSRFAQMLIAEAKLAAQLSHANIVQTYDLGRESQRLYIAMEYVEGFDLNELLRRCSRASIALPIEFAFFIMGEVLRALDYAHRRKDEGEIPLGIVHRDVSPSNILISLEGEVKLCDFGISRAMSVTEGTVQEAIEGKAGYMSPEHARGETIDARADVFAASIVLWEVLAGRRLYKSEPGVDLIALARRGEVPPVPDRGFPNYPRLAEIVARGLSPVANDRYPTAAAMARDLDGYVSENRLIASPLRLGTFVTDHFGEQITVDRRARERAAAAVEMGPLVQIQVVSYPPPAMPSSSIPAQVSAPNATQSIIPMFPPQAPRALQSPSTRRGAGRWIAAGLVIVMLAIGAGWMLARW